MKLIHSTYSEASMSQTTIYSGIFGLRMDEPQSKMIPEMVDQKKLPKKKKWMQCGISWRNHNE